MFRENCVTEISNLLNTKKEISERLYTSSFKSGEFSTPVV